jgi:hypothetical protein
LISFGQLCDEDNCVAIFTKQKIDVYEDKMCVLSGTRNHTDGLWDIPPLATPTSPALPITPTPALAANAIIRKDMPTPAVNAIIRKDMPKTALAQYLYGCCGSPVMSTWQRAIRNGNFVTWPSIDSWSIGKNLPKTIASAKGHLVQQRKNLQSTKKPLQTLDDNDFFPLPDSPNEKTYSACTTIEPFEAKHKAYHDLTGRFPHRPSRGNEYILIIYDYDSNKKN